MKERFKIPHPLVPAIFALALFLAGSCMKRAGTQREKINFDQGWRFELSDSMDYSLASYSDLDWRELDLPHNWSAAGQTGKDYTVPAAGDSLPVGTGWYRKAFRLPASDSLRRIYITFEGVYPNCEVYVNGHLVGRHSNGFISFQYDMTPCLHFGNDPNLIAVRVENGERPDPGQHRASGIYRNVWIEKTHPIHIDQRNSHITTHPVSVNSAEVEISIVITNTTGRDESLELVTRLMDERNKVIDRQINDFEVNLKNSVELTQRLVVNSPRLWSVEDPYQYRALSVIKLKNRKIDIYETTFGIRYYDSDLQEGSTRNSAFPGKSQYREFRKTGGPADVTTR